MPAKRRSNGLTDSDSLANSVESAGSAGRFDSEASALLSRLSSLHAEEAWGDFLLRFGDTLYQVAGISAQNEEDAADCFVFVCAKLAENGFRRLLRFKPNGTASFSTWLRVVARNLCFDWQRKVHGRPRLFKSLHGLGALDLEVYYCRYERGLSAEDTLQSLRSSWPALTNRAVSEAENRIAGLLSPRQHWILAARQSSARPVSLTGDDEGGPLPPDVADPAADPESRFWHG